MKSRKRPEYGLIDHTADLGIRVCGPDPVGLYENAARSLVHLMLGDLPQGSLASTTVTVTAEDPADLMVRWLGEILYLFDGEGLVVTAVKINRLEEKRLEATLGTVPFDANRHDVRHEIKAVTYHQIHVAQRGREWEARIIFDV